MSEQMAIAIVALLLGWFVGILPMLLAKAAGYSVFLTKEEAGDEPKRNLL